MKITVAFFFFAMLSVSLAFGQSEIEKRIKNEIWNNAPAAFKNTTVPDKWKKESAVTLAFHREYILDFTTKVTGLANVNRFYVEKLNYHFRIKLLDKAAVTDYSELSFNSKTIKTNLFGKASAYRMIGIKVIKPNGEEREVDLSQAVKTDVTSSKELKIPVPNLMEGDIIDYFIAIRDESITPVEFGDEYVLEYKHPVVSNTIVFTLPHQYTFHYDSYNGAPDFSKEKIDKDVTYTLKDEMRDKAPDLIWNYPMQSAPHFRYRIATQSMKPEMDKEARKLLLSSTYNPADVGFIMDFMDANFKKGDPRVLTRELYYLMRNPIYMKAYYGTELGEPLNSPLSTNQFFLIVDKYLTKNKISHEILIAPSRDMAPWNRLVNMGSCEFFIRINTNPPVYLSRPHPFALPNEIPYMYEGTVGVSSTGTRDLDLTTAESNKTNTTLTVSLDAGEPGKINVHRHVHAKGHNKLSHQYLIFTNYDYMQAYDLPKYQVQKSSKVKAILKEYNAEKAKYSQRITQDYHERDERIKKSIEYDAQAKVTEYKDLKIKTIGMWDTEPDTEYEDAFVLEDVAKKVGPNILVEIGKLIDRQTEIKDEQKLRSRDVFMPYPRSFVHEIRFTIPPGYKLEGTAGLNKETKNETGAFVSEAKVEGNTLIIKTTKTYNRYHYASDDWSKLVPFLTAATDFYTAKVLLKKI